MLKKILFYSAFLFFGLILEGKTERDKEFITAAYLENWSLFSEGTGGRKSFSINTIDPELLTDLYAAFAVFGYRSKNINPSEYGVTGNFKVEPLSPLDPEQLYPSLKKLKEQSKGKLRLFLSIGGDTFNNPKDPLEMGKATYRLFSQMVATPAFRKEFIDSAIAFAHEHGFDGIDIDWEYPGDLTRGGREEDFSNFIEFLKECSKAFHESSPSLLLSFCAPPAVPVGTSQRYRKNPSLYFDWLKRCSFFTDRITLMAYNYHTPYGDELTGVNAPLKRDTFSSSELFISKTLDHYLKIGIAPNKLLLGIPLYGWCYKQVSGLSANETGAGKKFVKPGANQNSILSFFEIMDKITNKNFYFKVDAKTDTAYCYKLIEKEWISFDTPETVALKVKEALKRRLGGVIFWAINLDEYEWNPKFPNLKQAHKEKADAYNLHYR